MFFLQEKKKKKKFEKKIQFKQKYEREEFVNGESWAK